MTAEIDQKHRQNGLYHLTVSSGGYGSAKGEKINKLSQIESNFHENESNFLYFEGFSMLGLPKSIRNIAKMDCIISRCHPVVMGALREEID